MKKRITKLCIKTYVPTYYVWNCVNNISTNAYLFALKLKNTNEEKKVSGEKLRTLGKTNRMQINDFF